MIGQVRNLYRRYAATHAQFDWAPRPIETASGETLGYIDRMELTRGLLRVTGWANAERVTLVAAGLSDSAIPAIWREDVAAATGLPSTVGFEIALPVSLAALAGSEAPGLKLAQGGREVAVMSLPLSGPAVQAARWRCRLGFLGGALAAAPAALRWMTTRDPAARDQVKRRLRLDHVTLAGRLDPAVFDAPDGAIPLETGSKALVILPVYNGYDLLEEVLDRLDRHSGPDTRIIAIEDASPDARVRPLLRDWAARQPAGRVHLVEHAENRGFIRGVNEGLALARGPDFADAGPVVLLNADAMVPDGWLPRLLAPLADPDIASATAMSNDAEIFTAPAICVPTDLAPGQADAIDAVAATLAPGPAPAPMPTGVGFCMALSRDWLARVPEFDTAFGRGYGEEVDWCQRVRALGGRHVAVPGLYVEHRGGTSFGAEKAARVAENNAVISRRYPDYDREVQDFIAADPLRSARLALGIAWAGSLPGDTPVPIWLAHSLGGGADHWLAAKIAEGNASGVPSIVLRVGGARRWQVELVTAQGTTSGTTQDFELVERLLTPLPRRRIVYSCGVGDPDPAALPLLLARLKRGPRDVVEMLFHDYFPISPSYTLLDADGVYRGPVTPDRTDPAHRARVSGGSAIPVADWQAAWHALAREADELRVFSPDGVRQVTAAWPDLADRIRVAPHSLAALPDPVRPPRPDAPPVIAVLGNIGLQKGAGIVQDLARRLAPPRGGRSPIGLVLIGNIDPTFDLPDWVEVTGTYRPADIGRLAQDRGVTHWLVPSIWPETFCFTVREALATGLPVMAFALGAQGEAVAEAPNGHPLPFTPGADLAETVLAGLAELTGESAA